MMQLKIYRYFPLFLSLMFLITSCVADTPIQTAAESDKGMKVTPSVPPSLKVNRFALVIGNANYERGFGLENPGNDATDMANLLRQVGFTVTLVTDVNQEKMEEAIRKFGAQLKGGGTGLFYFSGHGAQYNGKNYLLPLGAISAISAPGHLDYKTVRADYVLAVMEEARTGTNIVILDACRDNPFKSLFKGDVPRGFAPMPAPSGTLIAYATKAGEQALDGKGQRNSPYVRALKQELLKPGVQIEEMLKNVRLTVMEETQQRQAPAYYNELNSKFCFVEPCGQVVEKPTTKPTTPPPVSQTPEQPGPLSVPPSSKMFTNSIGMKFVLIPAGKFMMGAGPNEPGESDEYPYHQVTIAKPFYMGQSEVTQEQWEKVMGNNPSHFKGPRNPVETVSWDDVQEFISRLNALEKTDKYRLPTEAEWEYAAKAGTETAYWWGNTASHEYANYGKDEGGLAQGKDLWEFTAPVCSFPANPFGLCDTAGNVWEWTCSEHEEKYNGKELECSGKNRTNNGNFGVIRGGSWFGDDPRTVRASDRGGMTRTHRGDGLGFRLARM